MRENERTNEAGYNEKESERGEGRKKERKK
jgi:hypothetical protein